jgi:PKD repeat protein
LRTWTVVPLKVPSLLFLSIKTAFNVKLITNTSIKDENGNTKIVTLENYVTLAFETYPVAKFGDNNGCGNRNIAFKDSSANRTGGVTSWYWSFGNGDTSTLQNPTYQYPKFGTYGLKMVAVSKSGCASDTVYKTFVVADKPIADFEQITPCINEKNQIKNLSTIHSPDVISKQQWFFGDGTASGLLQPEKIYGTAGSFLLKLVCTSNNGCVSDTAVKTITVEDYPVAAFKNIINSCQGLPLQFLIARMSILEPSVNGTGIWGTMLPPHRKTLPTRMQPLMIMLCSYRWKRKTDVHLLF